MVSGAPGWVMQEDKAGAEKDNIQYLQQHVGWWREMAERERRIYGMLMPKPHDIMQQENRLKGRGVPSLHCGPQPSL